MSGWKNTDRRKRLPKDWEKIRAFILERDNWTCVQCGQPGNEVDHIKPKTDDHRPNALQTLCRKCHQAKTNAESTAAYWGRRREIKERFNAPRREMHPGTISQEE